MNFKGKLQYKFAESSVIKKIFLKLATICFWNILEGQMAI